MKRQFQFLMFVVKTLILTILIGTVASMDLFKNDFDQQWEELSSDINKHNDTQKRIPLS